MTRTLFGLALAALVLTGCGRGPAKKPAAPAAVGGTKHVFFNKPLAVEREAETLAFMNRGLAFLERYEYPLAAKEFEGAALASKDWYPAFLNLGIAQLNLQDQPADALFSLKVAARLAPDQAAPHFLSGIVYSQGMTPPKPKEAEAAFRKAVELAPEDADARHRLAMAVKERGDLETAERLFSEALDRNPNLGAALYQRGLLRRTLGKDKEGRADLLAFQEMERAGANDERGMSYGFLGPLGDAVRNLYPWLDPDGDPSPASVEWEDESRAEMKDPGGVVAVADLDDDGVLDLVFGGEKPFWRRNKGDFEFGDPQLLPVGETLRPGADLSVGDMNNDGRLDLVIAGSGLLLQTDKGWNRVKHPKWDASGARLIADLDADGDLDVVADRHLLLNDAKGNLTERTDSGLHVPSGWAWRIEDVDDDGFPDIVSRDTSFARNLRGGKFLADLEVSLSKARHVPVARLTIDVDLNGDGYLDRVEALEGMISIGEQTEPSKAQSNLLHLRCKGVLHPNGKQFGWTNPRGIGTRVEVFTGRMLETKWMGLEIGGPGKPPPDRLWFDLGDATKADLVSLRWTEGVIQAEPDVKPNADGTPVVIEEVQRKAASCPVVFSWDGDKWAFVADSMGAGGLGFFMAPGMYWQPDTTERIRIDRSQLRERDGHYDVILSEPFEEIRMPDRLALVALDHPEGSEAYPDESFGGDAGNPSERVYWHRDDDRLFPEKAVDHHGEDVMEQLSATDRTYPEDFDLHRDLVGFTDADHWVDLDFGDRIPGLKEGERLVLFCDGYIEYGYSRTFYAADQSKTPVTVPTLEFPDGKDGWKTGIESLGYMAGSPRTMTRDVTGVVSSKNSRFRIRTNLEIYWDRIWLAVDWGEKGMVRTRVVPSKATLRYGGFPEEVSPDGKHPKLHDYQRMMPGVAGFKAMAGEYTKYGDVRELLLEADDRTVIFRNGEEILLRFPVKAFPPLKRGWVRTFMLETEGWCKDMDPYTAEGTTVEPLPWRGMTHWPPKEGETIPDTEAIREWRREWNTRRIR